MLIVVTGMDFEGIYRKSGGASSMRAIQESFERGEELDIGDSVDICGVTSVLKQYFRKLPTPIITPAIYDEFLNATSTFSSLSHKPFHTLILL